MNRRHQVLVQRDRPFIVTEYGKATRRRAGAAQDIHDDVDPAQLLQRRVDNGGTARRRRKVCRDEKNTLGGKLLRFSDLERAIPPAISQKMLIQQLRQMEKDGVVRRIVHHQVPPKVEYGLTDWGQALCPALDALLKWAILRESGVDTG